MFVGTRYVPNFGVDGIAPEDHSQPQGVGGVSDEDIEAIY